MPEDNLRDTIKEMMVENLMLKVTKEEIADDLPLFGPGGLGLDSVAILDFIMDLEDRFDISIPLDRVAEVQTIAELSRAVAALKRTPG